LKNPSNTTELMGSESISDAECVRRIQRGETETFEILVRRHEKAIFNVVYRMLGDYDDAAETAQEVFLSAYRAMALSHRAQPRQHSAQEHELAAAPVGADR
jgi:DNA-directed RNA polymerase specialized sigma24 family protein